MLPFFDSPFSKLESEINSKELREIQHEVCIEWKSPLQVEIAPFLWEFYNHLTLLEKYSKEEKNALEEWANRRYSSPLLEIIKNSFNLEGNFQKLNKVVFIYIVVMNKNPTAHYVKENIGCVMQVVSDR